MGSKRYCTKVNKSIFPDELTAKIWAANGKYSEDSEPYRDPQCGHIHLRTISKRKRKKRK